MGISSPTRGTKEIMDSSKNIQININYLATVVFGLIYASREIQSGENKIQVSEFISGITNFLDSLINMNIDEDDLLTLSAMLESAHLMLKEIAPIQYTEFNSLLSDVDVTDSNGETISFKLISDIDLVMEQSIYLYDSKIGFVVNQITIEGLKHLDQEIIYSMDLMFRLCSGVFHGM